MTGFLKIVAVEAEVIMQHLLAGVLLSNVTLLRKLSAQLLAVAGQQAAVGYSLVRDAQVVLRLYMHGTRQTPSQL